MNNIFKQINFNKNGDIKPKKFKKRILFTILPFPFLAEVFYWLDSNGFLFIKNLCNPVCSSVFSDKDNTLLTEEEIKSLADSLGCNTVCDLICSPICNSICDSICNTIY